MVVQRKKGKSRQKRKRIVDRKGKGMKLNKKRHPYRGSFLPNRKPEHS